MNAHGGAGQDAGRSECRSVTDRIRDTLPGPKGSPRPAGEPSRESPENHLRRAGCRREKRKKAARACAPLIPSDSEKSWWLRVRIAKEIRDMLFPTEEKIQDFQVGQPTFGELEPSAGKPACCVLRGARGQQRPLAYPTCAEGSEVRRTASVRA